MVMNLTPLCNIFMYAHYSNNVAHYWRGCPKLATSSIELMFPASDWRCLGCLKKYFLFFIDSLWLLHLIGQLAAHSKNLWKRGKVFYHITFWSYSLMNIKCIVEPQIIECGAWQTMEWHSNFSFLQGSKKNGHSPSTYTFLALNSIKDTNGPNYPPKISPKVRHAVTIN